MWLLRERFAQFPPKRELVRGGSRRVLSQRTVELLLEALEDPSRPASGKDNDAGDVVRLLRGELFRTAREGAGSSRKGRVGGNGGGRACRGVFCGENRALRHPLRLLLSLIGRPRAP